MSLIEKDWNFIFSYVSEFSSAKMVLILWEFLFKKRLSYLEMVLLKMLPLAVYRKNQGKKTKRDKAMDFDLWLFWYTSLVEDGMSWTTILSHQRKSP